MTAISKRKVVYLRPGTLSRSRGKRQRYHDAQPTSVDHLSLPHTHLEDLAKYWTVKAVQLEQQSAFLAVIEGLSEERKKTAVAEELDRVKKGKSMAQLADRGIANRESEIAAVKELLGDMEKDSTSVTRSQLEQLAAHLTRVRQLSLEVVRAVQLWRERLFALNPSNRRILKLPYIWQGGNYLLKLRTDLAFLKDSPAARYWDFSARSDPFLQYPPHAFRQQKPNQRKLLDLPIPQENAREVKLCERIVLEEVLNGKELDRTFRRGSESDRRDTEGLRVQSTSNDGGRSDDRLYVQPASEELVRPVTRGKEKQFPRARMIQRTLDDQRDESV